MLFPILLSVHILLGVTGFICGLVALRAGKRPGRHTRVGEAYHWVMFGVCVTASAVASMDWQRLWGFVVIAGAAYLFALLGYIAAKRRWQGWLRVHVIGQGGSFVAMVTAILVVNWERCTGQPGLQSPWALFVPTIIGMPLVVWVQQQVALGKRPKL